MSEHERSTFDAWSRERQRWLHDAVNRLKRKFGKGALSEPPQEEDPVAMFLAIEGAIATEFEHKGTQYRAVAGVSFQDFLRTLSVHEVPELEVYPRSNINYLNRYWGGPPLCLITDGSPTQDMSYMGRIEVSRFDKERRPFYSVQTTLYAADVRKIHDEVQSKVFMRMKRR